MGLVQIVLELQEGPKERYSLSVRPREVRLSGAAHGLFNGLMTLRQLMTEGALLIVRGEVDGYELSKMYTFHVL